MPSGKPKPEHPGNLLQCWAVTSYCNLVTVIILLFAVTSSVTVTETARHKGECSKQ